MIRDGVDSDELLDCMWMVVSPHDVPPPCKPEKGLLVIKHPLHRSCSMCSVCLLCSVSLAGNIALVQASLEIVHQVCCADFTIIAFSSSSSSSLLFGNLGGDSGGAGLHL